MSDALQKLNDLFITYGAAVKPGDDLDWRDYQIKEEKDLAALNLLKISVDETNLKMEREGGIASPFCNPIIQVFQKLDFITRYFCGEFEIRTKNKWLREQLAGIWYELIRGWYFGTIYIAYGDDFEEIDKQKFIKDGKDFYLEGIPGKFRLYTRSSRGTFTSVLSGQSGIDFTPEQKSRIVKCDMKGYYNWLYWFKLWSEWLYGMQRFKASVECLSKNVVLTPRNNADLESIRKQFENNECFIKREGNQGFGDDDNTQMGKTKFEELIFMPRETPMAILEGVQRAFELHAAHLGFAGRLSEQKKERINAGENFPHQKVVSNVRTHLISTLNYLFDQMRIKFGSNVVPEDIKIVPANQAFAQGLPEYQAGGAFGNGFNDFNGFNKFNAFKSSSEDNQGND